jgi:RNA polymerase sigma-70 factor (ECF subfamily)
VDTLQNLRHGLHIPGNKLARDKVVTGVERAALTPFEQFALPHLDAAYTLARYLLRDPHDAEDAVQDAYLRALKYFGTFQGEDARAWILTIVRNVCYTVRTKRSDVEVVEEFEEDRHTPEDETTGPEAQLDSAIARATVREALAKLPLEFQEVLVLREIQGLSYKEIGAITSVPIGTVMSRLARGRARLAHALKQAGRT